jgi:hypothetical protein
MKNENVRLLVAYNAGDFWRFTARGDARGGGVYTTVPDCYIYGIYDCRFSFSDPSYTGIATLVGFMNASLIVSCMN